MQMTLYKKLPLKTMSRLWGQFNQLELPTWLRKPALSLYIWLFGCSLDEAAIQDLKHYRNLSEFFRRHLRPGIRPIDRAHIVVCRQICHKNYVLLTVVVHLLFHVSVTGIEVRVSFCLDFSNIILFMLEKQSTLHSLFSSSDITLNRTADRNCGYFY